MTNVFPVTRGEPWLLQPRECLTGINTSGYRRLRDKIRNIDPRVRQGLERRGISCAEEGRTPLISEALDRVDDLLSFSPTLRNRVGLCVEEVVLLHPPSDEYDVSHSEPKWPRRIYVSVPNPSPIQDLRVVEAVIHESMHLNLTLFETKLPLFSIPEEELYSPWRDENRPASGVFHGLYVFSCISQFLANYTRTEELNEVRKGFAQRRIDQIRVDISKVDIARLRNCVSHVGNQIIDSII